VPIYGVPQTFGNHTIIAASEAPLHTEFATALVTHSPPAMRERLEEVYGDPPRLLASFDLFVVHELVHLYCEQRPGRPAPLWATELLCSLGLVGYLHEEEPGQLATLLTAAEAAAHLPSSALAVTALVDMEQSFDGGQLTFGWYIQRLTAMADEIWRADGPMAYRGLYDLLHPGQAAASTAAVTLADIEALSPSLRQAIAAWPATSRSQAPPPRSPAASPSDARRPSRPEPHEADRSRPR
jgi:hypothetical protein